jgi:hypothetical protein
MKLGDYNMKEYTFDTQEINGKNEIVLCLQDFQDVKFIFKSIKFGDVDEDNMVPVIFEIGLIDENQKFPENPEFENQAAQILVDILEKMSQRKYEIANSFNQLEKA